MLDYLRSLIVLNSRKDERGASAVEYGLLVALIAAVIVVIVLALGGVLKEAFEDTCKQISGAGSITADCS
jgi:pilus assembly protein Flp/PilA